MYKIQNIIIIIYFVKYYTYKIQNIIRCQEEITNPYQRNNSNIL